MAEGQQVRLVQRIQQRQPSCLNGYKWPHPTVSKGLGLIYLGADFYSGIIANGPYSPKPLADVAEPYLLPEQNPRQFILYNVALVVGWVGILR